MRVAQMFGSGQSSLTGPLQTLCRALLFLSALPAVHGLPREKTDDQVQAAIDAGTFKDPSANVRPRFRYWIPDASADLDTVVDDVKEIGRVGGSGFELLGFYLYGGPPNGWGTYAPVDWSVYGWGTKAWQKLFTAFAKATKENGLIMDFAMGPNQGQGVPAPYNDDGKAWDLSVLQTAFDANETSFDGTLNGWGIGPLEAVVLAGAPRNSTDAKLVAMETLEDVTSRVTSKGHLKLELPFPDEYKYTLFSAYLVHSHYPAQNSPLLMEGPQTAPKSWVENGSWAVDHFSARGAQTAIKFWEDHLLNDELLSLIKDVGNYAWEDSVELKQKYRWTKGFLDRFEKENKYKLQRFLPVIFGLHTDQWDQGDRYTEDYRSTLARGYGEFLSAWTEWTNRHLGIQYSCQVSYGMSLDELENVPKVNAPEDESLEYANEIDRYRQYAGPANLAGKRVISNELAADIYKAFQQTLPELLDIFKRAVAGGVNQAVIHGSPYSGDYGNTTWPGMMTFGYQFADCHNRHQPAWDDYRQALDTIARHQYVFQTGIPRRDVVFWQKRFWYPGNTSYAENDLENAGYTYEYLSPSNFDLPEAKAVDGVFAPNRQAFKALVVRIYDFLTLKGVKKLAEYAREGGGLPIIFSGGVPTRMWSYRKCEAEQVSRIMHQLAELDNVHVVVARDEEEEEAGIIAKALASIGVEPRTKVESNGTWHTVWREDTQNDVDYVFVYNEQGNYTTGTVEFASTKIPYWFDAWTGEQTPVLLYTQTEERTKIAFQLQGNQSHIVAFMPKAAKGGKIPSNHATSASDNILSISSHGPALSVKAGSHGQSRISTSDGKTHKIPRTAAKPFELTSWKLTVEHWDPPADMSDARTTAVKTNSTHRLGSLVSWQDIDGLEDVSGRGYYKTTFHWPPTGGSGGAADGAFLDFGRIQQTLAVTVNGERLPPLDFSQARADIGPYLRQGKNEVEAVIATTLINVLRPIWSKLRFSGTTATKDVPPRQEYGLKAPVVVTPYKETLIRGKA